MSEDEVGYGLGGCAVEAVGVFDERRITTFLHVGADVGDDAVDFGILRGLKGQQGFEFGLEIGRLGVEFFMIWDSPLLFWDLGSSEASLARFLGLI